jgi:hypothetical protein
VQIYFLFSFLKSQKTLKPQNLASHRTTESSCYMTTCANSPTLPVVQPQSFNSIFKPPALSFHPTTVSKSTLKPLR